MEPVSLLILILTVAASYKGFKDHGFYDRYAFSIEAVKNYKQYQRLITSGFLHVSWTHLVFNMFALFFFSSSAASGLGSFSFLVIYFGSMAGGNLLSLVIHRYHNSYTSVGASGAICGVIFASIAAFPGMRIGLFLLPPIPGWLFGLVYVLVSIYGIRSRSDNIGHDAHLGGGLAGMLIALLIYPEALLTNYVTILIVAVPAIAFILFIFKRPEALLIDNLFEKKQKMLSVEDRYNISKKNKQQTVDALLEKIHRKGINSLSAKEKSLLEEYTK